MKSPDPINTVYNNDKFSDELKEAYERWMGGDTFQNTNLQDVHEVSADSLEAGVLDLSEHHKTDADGNVIPHEEKEVVAEAPFDGMDPQSHGAEIENVAVRKKETKKVNPVGSKETVVSKEETESKLWDEVSSMLSKLGELSGTKYKVVGEAPATVEGYKNKKIAKIMSVKK
tara:strand:- start:3648 stop:4163 length:516 start_codon:yes stop_codon:yes gene_type:complete